MEHHTFRSSGFTLMAGAMAVGWPLLLISLAVGAASGAVARAVLVALAVVGAATYARAATMRIVAGDDGITVVRLLSTVRVPWDDVVGVVASYEGTTVLRAEGRPVTLHTISRSRAAVSRHQRGFADEVAELLDGEARSRRA